MNRTLLIAAAAIFGTLPLTALTDPAANSTPAAAAFPAAPAAEPTPTPTPPDLTEAEVETEALDMLSSAAAEAGEIDIGTAHAGWIPEVSTGGSFSIVGSVWRTNDVPVQTTGSNDDADFDGSGTVEPKDIYDFIAAYLARDPTADIDGSGAVGVEDLYEYLGGYFGRGQ